jgi:hypothetical protein
MPHDDLDIFKFRAYCDLAGNRQSISYGRRNGRRSVFLPRSFGEPAGSDTRPIDYDEQNRLFINLNSLERQTWRKILSAHSIANIAEQEGVSRAAIYARIQGNAKGQGGMIAKNFWVLLWWRLRQRQLLGEEL